MYQYSQGNQTKTVYQSQGRKPNKANEPLVEISKTRHLSVSI